MAAKTASMTAAASRVGSKRGLFPNTLLLKAAATWPWNRSIRQRVINPKGLKQSSLARACEVRPAAPSPAQMLGSLKPQAP
jgi:hypothetical protein